MKGTTALALISLTILFVGCLPEGDGQVKLAPSSLVAGPHGTKARVSMAQFDAIKEGMTYEEAMAVVGSDCKMQSEVNIPGSPELRTVSYGCDGHGMPGANVTLMFQGGKLNMKAQFGLR